MNLLLVALFFFAAASPDARVRAVLQSQQEAWNRGDIRTFMSGYENSPETTYIGRSVVKGYQAILDNYVKRYADKSAMGHLTFHHIEVRLVSADVAITTGEFHLKRDARGGGDASGRFTLVLRRGAGGVWRIIHDHTG
ncbi:MAG: SgcJ/EcaC family oxidoreductase [Bryobacterales bacterium]|nr:SgcJ/EcaC family oxidoreductase [Bryobacterales bacterium]